MRLLPVLLLTACMDGPAGLTLISDLRVLNITVDPASPAVGETPVVEPLVADPAGEGFGSWTWWCVGDTCGDGPLPEGVLAEVYALACEPGACEGPGDLSDPDSWLSDLGIEGVSLALRRVPISPSPEVRLNDNPVLTLDAPLPESVAPSSATLLNFRVDDAVTEEPTAFGFATAGGFAAAEGEPVVDGAVTLELFAPEEAGTVDLYVVVEDGLGGSAVWTGAVTVE